MNRRAARKRGGDWPALVLLLFSILAAVSGAGASAQDHVVDLRLLEISDQGDRTYHNALWSWSFAQRWSLETFWLSLPGFDSYDEPGIGLGFKLIQKPQLSITLIGLVASAPDDEYFEPAVLLADNHGKLTGSIFLLHYLPLSDDGIDQWLIDPVEMQYRVGGPVSLGVSGYFYRPQGGRWLTKVGPKISVADSSGATELAARRSNQGDWEFQLRRLFFF